MKTSLINILLRSATLLSKFIFILFLARIYSPANVGLYGVMTGIILTLINFLGLEFHIFNTREILKKGQKTNIFIRDQFVFHFLTYIIAIPPLILIFIYGFLPWDFALAFFILVILEHLTHEIYRILIILGRPTISNIIIFLKNGIWIYFLIFGFFLGEVDNNLIYVWKFWIGGNCLALILGLVYILKLDWKDSIKERVNWEWIRRGLLMAMPFFGSAITIKGIEYGDRYFLKYFLGDESAGVYTFFSSFSGVVITFVVVGIVQILFPKLVFSYQNNQPENFKKLLRKLKRESFLVSVGIAMAVSIGIYPVLNFIGKTIYIENIEVLWVLLFSSIVMCMTFAPQYTLFVKRFDGRIFIINSIGLVFAVVSNIILIPKVGVIGAPIANLIANSMIFLLSMIALNSSRVKRMAGCENN